MSLSKKQTAWYWREFNAVVAERAVAGEPVTDKDAFRHELHVRALGHADQLVELDLQSLRVAVLCVLDEEDHQEGDNRCTGIDDQLPRIGEVEQRPGHSPYQNNEDCDHECPGRTSGSGDDGGEPAKGVLHQKDLSIFLWGAHDELRPQQ